jgi:hypothetical protein
MEKLGNKAIARFPKRQRLIFSPKMGYGKKAKKITYFCTLDSCPHNLLSRV